MKYENFSYLYPPRPEAKVSIKTLDKYDNGSMLGQPKLNGSNCTLYLSGDGSYHIYNRHGEKLTLYNDKIPFAKLHRGNGWLVLNGEYMNKSKKDETGAKFNHKFVIFDILVFENQHLVGTTLEQRVLLLETLFPCEDARIKFRGSEMIGVESDPFLCQLDVDDCYKVRNFTGGFGKLYQCLTKIDMYEGLVVKRKNAKLDPCYRPGNNSNWQIKIRKETKNYQI